MCLSTCASRGDRGSDCCQQLAGRIRGNKTEGKALRIGERGSCGSDRTVGSRSVSGAFFGGTMCVHAYPGCSLVLPNLFRVSAAFSIFRETKNLFLFPLFGGENGTAS